jgi:hypothetical protein
MVYFILAVLVILVVGGGLSWWMNRRVAEVESETAYLPGGGAKPVVGNAVYQRVRRESSAASGPGPERRRRWR